MVIRVKIKSINSAAHFAYKDFPSDIEADQYIDWCKQTDHWGKTEKEIQVFGDDGKTLETIMQIPEVEFIKEDVTEMVAIQELMKSLEEKGQSHENACHGCLRIIGGYNDNRQLTVEQIMEMATAFANIEQLLNRRMPKTAKAAINALVPDEVLVTTELKNLLLLKLKDF